MHPKSCMIFAHICYLPPGDDSSPAVNEETRLDNAKPHPPEKRGSQLSDYGLSHVVLERMKIKRVLSAMEKVYLSHIIITIIIHFSTQGLKKNAKT